MALDIPRYKKGVCFICNGECNEEAYVHYTCAVAYHDWNEERMKEVIKEFERMKYGVIR